MCQKQLQNYCKQCRGEEKKYDNRNYREFWFAEKLYLVKNYVLKQMQNSQGGYGQDAMQATNVLLKMSGQKVEKEFEVKDDKKKTETKKEETQSK